MNVVFDLDGTLIDSSERMYRLFQRLIPESLLTKEQYWSLKRNKNNHQMILEKYYPEYNYEEFNTIWLSLIEQREYLNLDCNYSDTIEVLSRLKKYAGIILLTARQSKLNLYAELERLELMPLFDTILVTEAKKTKEELLIEARIRKTNKDMFVSDMGKDIIIGKKLGYLTVGISHGFMSRDRLLEYDPDIIIDTLSEIKIQEC